MRDSYREDMLDLLRQLPEGPFAAHGVDKAAIMADKDSVQQLWGMYQKSVEEYDVDPDYALKDALHEVYGIPSEEWSGGEARTTRPLVYVCAPYAGEVRENVLYARAAALMAIDEGYAPIVPHLLYPSVLDDNDPEDRATGLGLDLRLMDACGEVWLFDYKGMSSGMMAELNYASAKNIPVRTVPAVERKYLDKAKATGVPAYVYLATVGGDHRVRNDGQVVATYHPTINVVIRAHTLEHAKDKLVAYLAENYGDDLVVNKWDLRPLTGENGHGVAIDATLD